jgi:hypothetical protein
MLMKTRSLFLTIAAGLIVSGIGAPDARAGTEVPLPTNLSNLLVPNTQTTVAGAETLTFSQFTYSSSSSPPPGSAGPSASIFEVNAFKVGAETGFSLDGTLNAAPNTMVDVSITYVVTAPKGELINDAVLITTGGGSGSYLVNETLTNAVTFAPITTLATSSTTSASDLEHFAGVNSILVTKDIFLSGGTSGESLSIITQAFSSSGVPEPSSMALMGIGITGLLAFRRLFKRNAVA